MNKAISPVHKYYNSFPNGHRDMLKCLTCQEENILSETCQFGDCQGCNDLFSMERLVELVQSSPEILKAWYVKYIRWEKGVFYDGKQ